MSPARSDFTDWLVSASQGHEIEIEGIRDMVDKVLAALGPSKKIKHFWIDSHGSPGAMYLGTDTLTAASLPTHSADLGRLRGRFSATRVLPSSAYTGPMATTLG